MQTWNMKKIMNLKNELDMISFCMFNLENPIKRWIEIMFN